MPPPLPRRSVKERPDLVTSLRQLRDCPYYWGPIDKAEAADKLSNQPVGAFLLRDSSDDKHFFALSFRMPDGAHHVRISYTGGLFSFDHINSHAMRYSSILDLVYNTMTRSRNREIQFFVRGRGQLDAPVPVNILYPISRDHVVHSLMHIARSSIRKHVRFDHLDKLNLPTTLKSYLKDPQYLYEESDEPVPVCDINQPPIPPPLPPSGLRQRHSMI